MLTTECKAALSKGICASEKKISLRRQRPFLTIPSPWWNIRKPHALRVLLLQVGGMPISIRDRII